MMTKSYNVQKMLSKYNIPFQTGSAGKELKINCLWHSDSKKHLYVNAQTGLFHCFKCNEKGSLYKLLKQIQEKQPYGTISISDFESNLKQVKSNIEDSTEEISWPENYYPLYEGDVGITGREARDYLRKRNISTAKISYYSIGFCSGGKYNQRIIIPVFNSKQELVSFVARDYTGSKLPKVLTPSAVGKSAGIKDHVFNLYNAIDTKHLIIGEGVFDAISLGTSGVAIFGKTVTAKQLAKIVNLKPLRITICLDSDAQQEAETLARQLLFHVKDVRVAYLEAKDPNEEDSIKLQNLIKKAKLISPGYSLNYII